MLDLFIDEACVINYIYHTNISEPFPHNEEPIHPIMILPFLITDTPEVIYLLLVGIPLTNHTPML